jgi:hypothetical protein
LDATALGGVSRAADASDSAYPQDRNGGSKLRPTSHVVSRIHVFVDPLIFVDESGKMAPAVDSLEQPAQTHEFRLVANAR